MALTLRQRKLYIYRASLYRPVEIAAYPDGAGGASDRAADATWNPRPAYVNVPCYFKFTPEVDLPSAEGLNKEANIFTLDVILFDAAQEISGQWLVELTAPQILGVTGGYWYVQDNPRTTAALGRRSVNQTQVFGKRGPDPQLGPVS